MTRKVAILAGVTLAVALLGLAVVVPAFAQGATPTPTPKAGCGWGRGFGFWCGSWATFDAAAKALGLTPEQLFAELHAGKALAEIAEAKGVDLQKVCEAMKDAQIQAMKDAIQQAVKAGKLTQEQADWLLKGLELGFIPKGRGFGCWFGFGGRGGWLFGSCAPSATSSPSSYSS